MRKRFKVNCAMRRKICLVRASSLGAQGEPMRMVTEKIAAAQASGMAATGAMIRGAHPVKVARVALAPVRRKTRANVRRLAKPGRK